MIQIGQIGCGQIEIGVKKNLNDKSGHALTKGCIEYKKENDNEFKKKEFDIDEKEFDDKGYKVTLNNLANNSKYFFKGNLKNKNGWGLFSNLLIATTS